MPHRTLSRIRHVLLALGLLFGPLHATLAAPGSNGAALSQGLGIGLRKPVESARYELPAETRVSRIVVKLHEGARVRLRDGALSILERNERERATMAALGLTEAQLRVDLAAIHRFVAQDPLAQGLDRLFKQDESVLAERRNLGEARSGRELADLDLYFEILLPPGTTQGEVSGPVAQLAALRSVEVAYADPVPEPAQTQTANLQGNQRYLNPAPQGIDALYSWNFTGGRGDGMRIVDVEVGLLDELHEDLPRPLFYRFVEDTTLNEHGTNVMGVMVAPDNGIGVTGIANRAQAGYYSLPTNLNAANPNVADAISRSSTAAGALTGIVLIELHAPGPVRPACTCNTLQCGFLPMEFWQANYDAIDTATANGTIVVEAGGNGSVNLDNQAAYGRAFDRSARDSWAILVGASGGATATQDLSATPACFTNFGGRVDLRAWGDHVATTGPNSRTLIADLANNGQHRQYTATFGGTSSAAPIVAGAAADLQSVMINHGRGAAGPLVLRQLLVDTGTLQETATRTTRPIGPQPNLRSAIDNLGFEGYLDGTTCTWVWGWAWNQSLPNTAINVDVFVDGALSTTTTAGTYRSDLAAAGKGNGSHGFGVSIPYRQGRHVVSTRFAGTGLNLGKSPKAVYCDWSIFTTQVPASFIAASPGYEVATQFSSKFSGNVTGLRFYEAQGETGSHTLKLWSDSGAPLGSVTIPATGVAGWRTAMLTTPVAISARTRYRVSVNTNAMQSKTNCDPQRPFFPFYNDPFTAHSGFWGPAGSFPTNGSCSNYFVDVVFNSTQ